MSWTHGWPEVYQAALLETDWSKMEQRLQAAESAIHERERELSLDHGGTPEERQAIADAARGLTTLRKEAESWLAQQGQQKPLFVANAPYVYYD